MAAYGSDAGFQAWLAEMGYTLPGCCPADAILRARGSAYIDGTYERLWTGWRTGGAMQELGWARTGATFNCVTAIASDVIPPAIVNAAYRAAYLEAVTPGILSSGATGGPRVKRQKVDFIEREFFDDGKTEAGSATGFIDPEIDGAMGAFICANAGGFFFESIGG